MPGQAVSTRISQTVILVRGAQRLLRLLVGLLLLHVGTASAAGAQVTDAHAEVREGVVYLDVDLTIRLDPEIVKALHNAIAVTLELQTVIERPRDWWWPDVIASDERRYRLEYHALSRTWMVTDFLARETHTFSSLDGALRALERVRAWPVAASHRLAGQGKLIGRTRLVLDVNKLPLPLRLPALFDRHWSLDSHWYLWSPPAQDAPATSALSETVDS